MDRRQFIKSAVAAGVAAALPAIPEPVVTAGGNTLLSPELVAREALAHLKANMRFVDLMKSASKKMDAQPVPTSNSLLSIDDFARRYLEPMLEATRENDRRLVDRDVLEA